MRAVWEPDVTSVHLGSRALFPDLSPVAYLNHAAVSPPSREVQRIVSEVVLAYARSGIGAVRLFLSLRNRLRARLARLIGAETRDIALRPNTTQTVIDVAMCFPWRSGDRVLCFEGEFPANVTPWERAAETFGLELGRAPVAWLEDPALKELEAALRRGVRLVAFSAVQFQTGRAMPVAEITRLAHAQGAQVFVDAVQAVGAVPLDVRALNVDYLGCGSHKWLMGLEGAAFLYVRPDRADEWVPRLAGWLSHDDPVGFLTGGALRYDRPIRSSDPSFLEGGSPNVLGLAAFDAAVAPIEALGVSAIHAHLQRYHDALEPTLRAHGFIVERSAEPALRSGILAARPPDEVDLMRLARGLSERGVICGTPDGRLRFAPHWPNALDEVPAVLAALEEALGRAR